MIRRLPRALVERIAAGEVIERPASVVKELVENALDAGARRVEVTIEGGGKRRIVVADDGCGMGPADLALAFAAHATSKLSALDDLLHIGSFGFRGEALSSIGAVSRARITSRARGSAEGFCVACEGGEAGEPRPAAAPEGTRVEIDSLFFNTPARFRFLKGEPAETSRCVDALTSFALSADGVAFRLECDGRTVLEVPAAAGRRDRIRATHGRELADALIAAHSASDGIRVEGLLAPPALARARAPVQQIFLNGRVIKDATVKAAVRQAYREFLAPALQPSYFLLLGMDPAEVDVNVHPAKHEVRFRDAQRIFRAVHSAVLDALRGADLAARPDSGPRASQRSRGAFPPETRGAFARDTRGSDDPPYVVVVRETPGADPAPAAAERMPTPLLDPPARGAPHVPAVPVPSSARRLVVFETYVVYESGDDLVLVDQHALHERVLFEKLRRELAAGPLRRQRLLMPATVEVSAGVVARLPELEARCARLGLEVGPFGPTTLAVHAVPALLVRARPEELLDAVLGADPDDPGAGAGHGPLEERLHSLACHAAVRAGDTLADGEIASLLEQAAALPEAKACPHGRPTCVKLARSQLERWFKRSGF